MMHSSKTNPLYLSHTTVLHNLVQFNIGCITNSKKLFVFLNPLTQRLSVMGTTLGADISAHFSLFTQPFYEIIIIQECINMDCCLRVEILVLKQGEDNNQFLYPQFSLHFNRMGYKNYNHSSATGDPSKQLDHGDDLYKFN